MPKAYEVQVKPSLAILQLLKFQQSEYHCCRFNCSYTYTHCFYTNQNHRNWWASHVIITHTIQHNLKPLKCLQKLPVLTYKNKLLTLWSARANFRNSYYIKYAGFDISQYGELTAIFISLQLASQLHNQLLVYIDMSNLYTCTCTVIISVIMFI